MTATGEHPSGAVGGRTQKETTSRNFRGLSYILRYLFRAQEVEEGAYERDR